MIDPRSYVRLARELREGARGAVEASFDPPASSARLHRFVHGFALPFSVTRVVAREPRVRKPWLEALAIELAILVPLGIAVGAKSDDVSDALADGWTAVALATLAAIWFALGVVEWLLVVFAHEHHDALSYDVAALTYVPGEALAAPPRVRLDMGWLWTKAKRKLRGLLLVASAVPLFAIVLPIPGVGDPLFAALTGAWAAYWAAVFALANTHLAWEREHDAPDPWFLRALHSLGRIPLLGFFARLYARLMARITSSVHAACAAFEEAPYESAGLALARLVVSVPGVWIAVRPFFGPAATHALLGARYASGTLRRDEPVSSLSGSGPVAGA
jgi:hypothetical protein